MAPAAPPRAESAALLFGWDVFVSFALGPPPRGSRSYASDLARRLRERDFTVFFSEEEAAPGATLDDTLKRALHRARCLVVIANRGTLADPRWVRAEVEEFRRRHPDRTVIPISIDGALVDPAFGPAANAWLGFEGRIWIDESAAAFDEGVASDAVVDRLVAAPRLQRAGVRWRRTVRAAFAVLAALTLTAAWFAWSQYQSQLEASSGRLAAESQVTRAHDPALALLLAVESWRTRDTAAARGALAAALGTHPRLAAELERLRGADGYELNVRALRFSPDGRRLYALAGSARAASTLAAWDVQTRRRVALAWPPGLRPAAFVEHAQGHVVVALARPGDPATAMQLWDPQAALSIGPMLESLPEALAPALLTPDGRQVALAEGGPPQVQVRTLDDARVTHERMADERLSRTTLRLAADGLHVHGLDNGMALHRWRLPDWQAGAPPQPLDGVNDILNDGFAASADGRWLAFGGKNGQPVLWDLERGRPFESEYRGHGDKLSSLEFSADSRLLASASWDGTVRVWPVAGHDGGEPRPLGAHRGIVRHAVFGPKAQPRLLASAGADGRVLLWDLAAPPPMARRLSAPDRQPIGSLAFSPDGRYLLAARQQALELWDAGSLQPLWRLPRAHGADIAFVAVLPDGRGAVSYAPYARELKRWTFEGERGAHATAVVGTAVAFSAGALARRGDELVLQDAQVLQAYRLGDLAAGARIAAPAGRHFDNLVAGPEADEVTASLRDGGLHIYGPGLALRASMPRQADSPIALAGVPGSGHVAAVVRGRNDSVVLHARGAAAPAGAPMRAAIAQTASISVLAAAADGRTLLGAGIGFAALWDLELRSALGVPLPGHRDGPRAVAASPVAPLIATGAYNGEIFIWNLEPSQWAQQACAIANRNLSCAEWRSHQGTKPWRATCPALPEPADRCR